MSKPLIWSAPFTLGLAEDRSIILKFGETVVLDIAPEASLILGEERIERKIGAMVLMAIPLLIEDARRG